MKEAVAASLKTCAMYVLAAENYDALVFFAMRGKAIGLHPRAEDDGSDWRNRQKIMLRRHAFTGRVKTLFDSIDLMLVPVQSVASPTVEWMGRLGGNEAVLQGLLQFTCPFDMSGNPTITLPGGFTPDGMPIGFQFVSAHWAESLLVRAGVAYQGATNWHRQHPPRLRSA
ncbi:MULTISPECIES: amidase family protein [unclassified Acidisoma]|uniref:amidase family protein n=1 Tax=unclassified Acidisoma TaxID=2634065 RepID=UPI0020B15AA3|nr:MULTISPECIES: amidase family protein [unclassified Acidisoma]